MSNPRAREFVALWKDAFEKRPTSVFHQILSGVSAVGDTLTVSVVLRNALRFADGIRSLSKLRPGDRVAILADGFGELVPLYHAFWLLGIGVVAIPNTTPPEIAVAQINNSGCAGLVYSPALAARLASIIPKISGIEFWLVTGVGRSGPIAGGKSVNRLDDLLQASSRSIALNDFAAVKVPENALALIAFTSGESNEPRGVGFTQEAICNAAKTQAAVYGVSTPAERFASLLPDKHIISLIHTLLVPLAAPLTSVVLSEVTDSKKPGALVEELYDNQVHALWMREDRLEDLRAASKSQKFALAKNFKVFLLPRMPLPAKVVEGVSNMIVPCFAQTEAGGVVAVGKRGEFVSSNSTNVEKVPIIGSGAPLAGVSFKVISSEGKEVGLHQVGELTIKAAQVMTSYVGSVPGTAYLSPENALFTGDRVQTVLALDGSRQVVVVGREDQFIKRGKQEINLLELESVIRRVVGVKDARVVGFTHVKYGKELGAFVLLHKKVQITREILWSNLLAFFPWELVPKVFMIAEASLVPILPSRLEIEDKLVKFSQSDFSRQPKL